MCAVGGPPDMGDPMDFFPTEYNCLDCGHKFKGVGADPRCPSCQSQNVKKGK